MAESIADKRTAVVKGESRYGIELGPALRAIAQAFPATVFRKWFAGVDDSSLSFRDEVLRMLEAARQQLVMAEEIKDEAAIARLIREHPELHELEGGRWQFARCSEIRIAVLK